ncbi:hypothetical protein CPC08DRAFT_105491 [Agrocybe pediades]|nr:hypothetical protein CPC08DRAFT_105491 [Agrocybe pediades]
MTYRLRDYYLIMGLVRDNETLFFIFFLGPFLICCRHSKTVLFLSQTTILTFSPAYLLLVRYLFLVGRKYVGPVSPSLRTTQYAGSWINSAVTCAGPTRDMFHRKKRVESVMTDGLCALGRNPDSPFRVADRSTDTQHQQSWSLDFAIRCCSFHRGRALIKLDFLCTDHKKSFLNLPLPKTQKKSCPDVDASTAVVVRVVVVVVDVFFHLFAPHFSFISFLLSIR